ncbi:MAG: membrane or secreted protein, partial [Bacteroidia bacterium]|nr:membrane or secreted protein [Bacteroidia bacterium]
MISSTQIFLFLLSAFFTVCGNSQSLTGAWETVITTDSGEKIRNVVIFSEGFQVSTNYYAETGKFIGTNGGSWDLNGDLITEVV